MGVYKKVSSGVNGTGKVTLKKEYAFGMDEKLFTPELEREKTKQRFNNYIKKMDMEMRFAEKYLEDKRHISLSKGMAATR